MVQDSKEHMNFYCTSTFLIFQGTWQNVGTWQVLTVLPIAASAAASRCECDCHRFAAKSEIVLNPQNKSCSSKSPASPTAYRKLSRAVVWARLRPTSFEALRRLPFFSCWAFAQQAGGRSLACCKQAPILERAHTPPARFCKYSIASLRDRGRDPVKGPIDQQRPSSCTKLDRILTRI